MFKIHPILQKEGGIRVTKQLKKNTLKFKTKTKIGNKKSVSKYIQREAFSNTYYRSPRNMLLKLGY